VWHWGARCLSQPRLLLLDEPLASLDAARRAEVLPYLEALRDRLSIPMVYVSHQFEEVLRLADHVVLLEGGRVVAAGGIHEMSLRPELAAIVGPDAVGAVLEGVISEADAARGLARLNFGSSTLLVAAADARVGARARVQLFASDLILATRPAQGLSVRNSLAGVVRGIRADDRRGAAGDRGHRRRECARARHARCARVARPAPGICRVGAGQSRLDAQPRVLKRPGLQARNERLQEAIGVLAIEHTVIDGERHVAFRAHDDALNSRLLDHRSALFQLADAENGRLRLMDDYGRR
jgi:hypothetical protein